jgi:hypothetical protein
MSPLTVGAAVAAVLAGPSLYTLAHTGQLDSTSALARGLLVAAACTVGAAYIQDMIAGYQTEIDRKHAQHVEDLAEAERLAQALLKAKAESDAQAQQQPPPGGRR